jgi:hypothetical protein
MRPPVSKTTYLGLFIITLSTLMYEILLTRIFSVTMWYHFAFMAISVAMFGMTVGAIVVYLFPGYFTGERAQYHLALSAMLFAITIVFSFLTHLSIPFVTKWSLVALYAIGLNYTVLAIPFFFSGICVCLALTKFPGQIGKLYAADLAGAAVGCILLIYTLDITDGPTAVIFVAVLACLGALGFAMDGLFPRLRRLGIVCTAVFATFAVAGTILAHFQMFPLRLLWVKGELEPRALYTKWNSFSRIRIDGKMDTPKHPRGWGMSAQLPENILVRQLGMDIDAGAWTVLTNFDGDLNKVDYLKYDVTNIVHYLRPDSRVLVVGVGGGRDVLSALAFNQRSILGLEINGDIINAVNHRYGDFTGHLDRNPKVTFVNDEARSYIARLKDPVDIIQVSLIDTWAATAAGAFVLTENSLYTVDAWKMFLKHISDRGVLTFSRWYFVDRPAEVYRLVALAVASLKESGISDVRRHLMLVRSHGVGTILVSKAPLTSQDIENIKSLCQRMGFDLVLTPGFALDPLIGQIASARNLEAVYRDYSLNITPPTDNSPFFFNMLRLRDIFHSDLMKLGVSSFNLKAVFVLGSLLIVIFVLAILCIIVPLWLTTSRSVLRGAGGLILFFMGIGLGFMLVEISQMQRLIVFLGHPIYGLSVVLFALLLSSGLGSLTTPNVATSRSGGSAYARLALLLGVLCVFGWITPGFIERFQSASTPFRILISLVVLFPIGFFMGMAFPMGMELASHRSPGLAPWLWGINGAMSVLASVLAVVIALEWGISTSFWTGLGFYFIAAAAFLSASRAKM